MPKLRSDQYLTIIFLIISLVIFPKTVDSFASQNFNDSKNSKNFENQIQETALPDKFADLEITPIPVMNQQITQQTAEEFVNSLTSKAIYVMDADSGSILLEKNGDETRAPASTTKMLTALTARNIYSLDEIFEVEEEAFTQGNNMNLQVGEKITVENLLNGLLIRSGNDAAFVLANNHPLGYQGFIAQMGNLALDLSLDYTFFTNPSGLDSDFHKTTAHDLAIMAKEIMKDDFLRNLVGTKSKTVTDVTGEIEHSLFNTNSLLGVEPGVVGVKTGTTWEAGETLVTQVDRDGHSIIVVVMASQDRYAETKAIISWVFENYYWLNIE